MMTTIIYDLEQMFELANVLRGNGSKLELETAQQLRKDMTQLESARAELDKYGLHLKNADRAASHKTKQPLEIIGDSINASGKVVNGLHNVLQKLDREAEAEASRIFGKLDSRRTAILQSQLAKLLDDPRAEKLGALEAFLEGYDGVPPDKLARELRKWLARYAADASTKLWLVANCGEAAKLLASNFSDEHFSPLTVNDTSKLDLSDPLVKNYLIYMKREGARPLDYFMMLTAEQRTSLALAYPSLIGKAEGAPADMRSIANRVRLLGYRQTLLDRLKNSQAGVGVVTPGQRPSDALPLTKRDEWGVKNRLLAIDALLRSPQGTQVLDYEAPNDWTQPITVVSMRVGFSAPPKQQIEQTINNLFEQTKNNHELMSSLNESLSKLYKSSDPRVVQGAREIGTLLHRSGSLSPQEVSELTEKFARLQYPIAVLATAADVAENRKDGAAPALKAAVKGGAGLGAGIGAAGTCTAITGPSIVSVGCPLVGLAASMGAEHIIENSSKAFDDVPDPAHSVKVHTYDKYNPASYRTPVLVAHRPYPMPTQPEPHNH